MQRRRRLRPKPVRAATKSAIGAGSGTDPVSWIWPIAVVIPPLDDEGPSVGVGFTRLKTRPWLKPLSWSPSDGLACTGKFEDGSAMLFAVTALVFKMGTS